MNDWDEAISDFLTAMKVKYKPSTLAWYGYVLTPLHTWAEENNVPLADFKRRHMERFQAQRADTVGKRSLEVSARCTRVFIRYCHQAEYIAADVLKDYKVEKSPKPHVAMPTSEDLRKLLKAVEDRTDVRQTPTMRRYTPRQRRFFRTRDYAFLAGLIQTGCRVSELCNLLLEDFHPDDEHTARREPRRATITFRATKGGEPRAIPVPEVWVISVKEWLKVRPFVKDCPTLFMTENGLPLDKGSARQRTNAYLKYAGIRHYTQHSFRHYAATEMAKVNVVSAARALGHERLETTMRYLHADAETVRSDVNAANVMGKIVQQAGKPPAIRRGRKVH